MCSEVCTTYSIFTALIQHDAYAIPELKGHFAMKKLILTATILSLLTACTKSPENSSSTSADTTTESVQPHADAQPNPDAINPAKLREAEAAAIAHDRYDPDSINEGAENIDIPPPQLKRKLQPGEALEVKFRPVDSYPNFQIITQSVLDTTRLRVVSEVNDVLDKVEMDNGNCKVVGVEPYNIKFPKKVYYGNVFNLLLDGCTAEQINEVYLYTTHGKLTYTAIREE